MSYPSPPIPHIGSTSQCVAEPQVVQNCLMSLLTVQQELEAWSQRSRMEVDVMYAHLCESIHRLRGFVHSSDGKVHFGIGALNRVSGGVPVTPPRHANAPSNMSGMLERLNPPGTGSAPYPSGPSGAFLASGPMSTSATPQRVGGTTSMNHSVHTTPNRGGKLTNLPFPGTSYGSSSAGGPHSHVMSSTGSNAPHGASKLPSGSGAHGTHGENENLKQHDDDAWHDITANISRELGGTTVNHVDDTRKGGSATSVTASSSGAIGEGITPPSLDTPDVTPMASPPCLEKRPVANLFGGGSAPINFELLFQQLSQEDVHVALPRSGVSDTERDPWAGYDSRSAASSAGNTPSQLHPRRPLNMALGGTVTPPSAHTPTTATGDRLGHTPSSGLATVRPSISMDTVLQCSGQNVMKHLQVVYADHGRPTVMRVEGMDESVMPPPLDPSTPCQVLVEFKRRRVLQYDSPVYIIPGEYAIVAGDRGDDLGLVIFSWYNTPQGVTASGLSGASVGKWIGLGIGKVVRSANPVEVSQVHGIQSELERRAVEVCQQRAGEFQLPMTIVDAEYQFDRKKLTFYYEANQRLDFRELVRDLYRTFRARIWMEMVDATL